MEKMEKMSMYMGSRNVVSIASVVEDRELRNVIMQSDYIRNETMRRLRKLPSYEYKSLKWKNTYYDYFKRKVIAEIEAMGGIKA